MTADNKQFVTAKVASGQFASSDDVIDEALRRWRQSDDALMQLRAAVEAGIEELDRGEGIALDIEEVIANGRQRMQQHAGRS